jgi:signal transduction histidine kinase
MNRYGVSTMSSTPTAPIRRMEAPDRSAPWEPSQLSPVLGTVLFALAFFAIRIGSDWFFRWFIAETPRPPLWTVLITTGIGTAISSVLVYLLLASAQKQFRAVRVLNHELRNSLQVLSFAAANLEPKMAAAARDSIARLLRALQQASNLLGEGPTWH